MGVVLAVKPGGGGGRVELPLDVVAAVEPDTDESKGEKNARKGSEYPLCFMTVDTCIKCWQLNHDDNLKLLAKEILLYT